MRSNSFTFSAHQPHHRLLEFVLVIVLVLDVRSARAEFTTTDIGISGGLSITAFKDVDADGKTEVITSHHKRTDSGAMKRYISIYGADGAKKNPGGAEIEAPDDAIAFALGDFLGKGRAQICYVTSNAFVAMDPDGPPSFLVKNHRFFFNKPQDDNLPYWEYVQDLDGDKDDDLILADGNGYVVYIQTAPGTLTRSGRIEGDFQFATQESTTIYTEEFEDQRRDANRGKDMPQDRRGPPPKIAKGAGWLALAQPIVTKRQISRLRLGDANADGKLDLLVMKRDKLHIALQTSSGGFADEPDLKLPLGPQGSKNTWDESPLPVADGDINGDKRVDFVVAEVDAKDLSTKLRLYLWSGDAPPAEPNQILKVSGLGEGAELVDVNNDGLLDLVYLTLRADKMMALRQPEVKELDATLFVFLFDKEAGQFTRSPDVKYEYAFSIEDGSDDIDGSEAMTNFFGDFNGDGTRDLFLMAKITGFDIYELEVSPKNPMKVDLPGRATISQEIAAPRRVWVRDLTGDGKSDIILRVKNDLKVMVAK